jgi:dipeptidyl aminopeptidase/acylaminoacyl peptidase
MKRATLIILFVASLAAVTFGQAAIARQQKLTVENALALKVAGAPLWSPDGQNIAFTVSEWNRKENRRDSHIYIVPATGGVPTRLTNGERGETSPQWSPDGTRIAFLADREPATGATSSQPSNSGRTQIWMIPVRGGEAERVTSDESNVTGFCWSPDGRWIGYVVRDTPKDKAERERRKKEKFDAIVVDSDYTYSHLWTINVATKEKTRMTEGNFSVSDPQWSPDGRWIAYVMSRAGSQESSYTDISEDRNTDIFIVSSNGSQIHQVTINRGPDSQPRWSPEGGRIAYLASPDPTIWAPKTDLLLISIEGGVHRNLTAGFNDSITGRIEWSPDGSAIFASTAVGFYTQLLRVVVPGGEESPVFERAAAYDSFDLSRDGRMLAYTLDDGKTSDDIWVATNTGRDPKKLTTLNPQLSEFALPETEVMKWKVSDGLEVEALLVKPLGYVAGRRYPAILQVHGGPYARFGHGFNWRAKLLAVNGYAVLMPNPRGSTGYGTKFAVANVRDWGGKDYQDLMSGVDELVRRGIADPDRLGIMGGSYGGFMTFWAITQTDRFKAAIGHAGISDWYSFHGQSDIPGLMEYAFGGMPWTARDVYSKYSPMTYVDKAKTPLMMTHGEQDRRVPIAQAEEYYRALRKRGVEVQFVRYPREGHGIQEPNHQIDLIGRQLEWFDRHLKTERVVPATSAAR